MALFTAKYAAYNELLANEIANTMPLCLARIVGAYGALTEYDYFCRLVSFFPPNGIHVFGERTLCHPPSLLSIAININPYSSRPFMHFQFNGDPQTIAMLENSASKLICLNSYEELALIPNLTIHSTLGNAIPKHMLTEAFARIEEIFAEMPVWPIRPVRLSRICAIS